MPRSGSPPVRPAPPSLTSEKRAPDNWTHMKEEEPKQKSRPPCARRGRGDPDHLLPKEVLDCQVKFLHQTSSLLPSSQYRDTGRKRQKESGTFILYTFIKYKV